MPRLTDKSAIRAILQRDPGWCVYALGDLSPEMFAKTSWFTPDLSMVLKDYGTSILFAMGSGSVREALDHVSWPVHLQVQADALHAITRQARVEQVKTMSRMTWTGDRARAPETRAARLGDADVSALERLYADGESSGEAPDFFYPAMVGRGVFFGIYQGSDLIAAAGTHLLSPDEGAAAIGNIYTRRDRRGRGLGRIVTASVMRELAGVETVGLNVRADNAPAIRLYESLGFTRHCEFYEAMATR
ncbi:MAG TPA: GNAT family N-acetyltransferase [Vicinamibacterales bacterium]|nr:GNAT family N-acetyltransferase [Vicinamibacterales bacterium]